MCDNFNVSLEIERNSEDNISINGYKKLDLIQAKLNGKIYS